jgi:hypothetical protein
VPYFEPDGPDGSAYGGYTTYVSDGGAGIQDTRLKRSSKYAGQNKTNPNSDCNMQKILPLTNNRLTLQSYVSGMISTGYTHIALGASWGWRTLSPTAPFTEGSEYGDENWTKAMVFLTDGLNTINSNGTWHKSNYTAYNYLIRGTLGTTDAAAAEIEQDEYAHGMRSHQCRDSRSHLTDKTRSVRRSMRIARPIHRSISVAVIGRSSAVFESTRRTANRASASSDGYQAGCDRYI